MYKTAVYEKCKEDLDQDLTFSGQWYRLCCSKLKAINSRNLKDKMVIHPALHILHGFQ
jgi:hypothetical protein